MPIKFCGLNTKKKSDFFNFLAELEKIQFFCKNLSPNYFCAFVTFGTKLLMFFFAFQFNVWTCNRINKLLWQTKLLHYANSKSLFLITHPSLHSSFPPVFFVSIYSVIVCIKMDQKKKSHKLIFFFTFNKALFSILTFIPCERSQQGGSKKIIFSFS